MSEPQITYDFDPRNLPPEYLQAIGLVVAASAQTESVVCNLIGSLLGIDNADSAAVTTHMSVPLRDNVVRSLIELKTEHSDIVDEIDDLMDAVTEAFATRNTIAHNSFAIHPETGEVLSHRMKARGSLQLELEPISIDEIQECAETVYDAGIAIVRFMMRVGIAPRPRTKPLMEPLDRKKKARAKRRNIGGGEEG